MIIVKHIEFYEVEDDPRAIMVRQRECTFVEAQTNKGAEFVNVVELAKLVRGKRFRRPSDNKELIIGMTKAAQEVLGIQVEAWENWERTYGDLYDTYSAAKKKLYTIQQAGFFTRLKWLFTGIK